MRSTEACRRAPRGAALIQPAGIVRHMQSVAKERGASEGPLLHTTSSFISGLIAQTVIIPPIRSRR